MSNSLAPYLIGIALLLPSCNHVLDGELLEEVAPVPINMSIGDSYITTRSVVTDITTSNLSSVGIYAAQEGSTAGQFPWTATPFAANIVPTGISNGQLSFASKLYYPLGGNRVSFYAYYPRTTNTATTANSYITAPGNGTAPVYHFTLSDQQDVMHAVGSPSGSNSIAPVVLNYNHKLAQIIINTKLLGGLQSMKLVAVPTKGSLNLQTGVVTWGSATADIQLSVPLLGGLSTAVFVPANVASYKLQVTLLILSTTYTLTSSTGSFLPGVVYTINF